MPRNVRQNSRNDSQLYGSELQEGYIRLIRLLPSKNKSRTIRCKLFEVSFHDAPRWEALSYTWGDASSQETIIMNDIKSTIRKNLFDCLYHLRGPNERILWVDAICINQENILERNHQVKQMKRIYESASRVIIWLGLKSDTSDLAIGFITALGQNPNLDHSDMVQELQATKELLARPYWKRLWIIQEIAVAARIRIQCGSVYTTWNHFRMFREEFLFDENPSCYSDDRPLLLHKAFGKSVIELIDCITIFWLDELRSIHKANGSSLDILLEKFENSQCLDVRDKVYGLVGLANDGANVVIDYSKSPFDLFVDLILRRSESRGSILGYARFIQRSLLGKVETPPVENLYSWKIAFVDGVHEAGIINYLGPIPDWGRVKFVHQYSAEHLHTMRLEAHDPVTVFSISSIIAYAIKPSETTRLDANIINGTKYMTPKNFFKNASKITNTYAAPTARYYSSTSTQNETRPLFFADEKGRIGIAPSNVRITDTICRVEQGIFNGSVAVILRNMGNYYSIIGRALFPYPVGQFTGKYGSRINLYLDIRTLQLLTKDSRTC